MGIECPKCKAKWTRLELEGNSLVQRCLCGLNKYLYHVSSDGTLSPIVPTNIGDAVTFPLENRNHYKCLLAIYKTYPDPLQTAQVAKTCGFKNKETYGFVSSLHPKG